MKNFDFYFDFGSPAAYLAWTQLPQLCADTGASVLWKPMLLGGVFQATGNHSPVTIPAKGRYVFKDFARFARRYGVPLNSNPFFPINTLTLMRAARALAQRLRQERAARGERGRQRARPARRRVPHLQEGTSHRGGRAEHVVSRRRSQSPALRAQYLQSERRGLPIRDDDRLPFRCPSVATHTQHPAAMIITPRWRNS